MADSEDTGKETRIVDVRGRAVVVRQLNDAQLLLLAREARLASKDDTEAQRRLVAVGRIFDILESAVIQEDDREHLLDITIKGELELSDLLSFISAFSEDQPKPRIRRGRYAAKST
jgi:hypothetical protein